VKDIVDALRSRAYEDRHHRKLRGQAAREIERLRAVIAWALGYEDFPERRPDDGPYWWRRELYRRALLDKGRAIKALQSQRERA
jgi:hypothetical protein